MHVYIHICDILHIPMIFQENILEDHHPQILAGTGVQALVLRDGRPLQSPGSKWDLGTW